MSFKYLQVNRQVMIMKRHTFLMTGMFKEKSALKLLYIHKVHLYIGLYIHLIFLKAVSYAQKTEFIWSKIQCSTNIVNLK